MLASLSFRALLQLLCCASASFERQPEELELPLAYNQLQEATHTTWICCVAALGAGVGFLFNWAAACMVFALAIPSLLVIYQYPVLLRVTEKRLGLKTKLGLWILFERDRIVGVEQVLQLELRRHSCCDSGE